MLSPGQHTSLPLVNLLLTSTQSAAPVERCSAQSRGSRYSACSCERRRASSRSGKWQ